MDIRTHKAIFDLLEDVFETIVIEEAKAVRRAQVADQITELIIKLVEDY